VASPHVDDDGNPICDDTHHEHFEFTCHWCEECDDKSRECAIGSLFVLFEPVSARSPLRWNGDALLPPPEWYDSEEWEMRPGIYRITEWPVYWDCMLDGGLYGDAFEWVRDLPDDMRANGGYADYPCGPLCRECEVKLTQQAAVGPASRGEYQTICGG